MRRPDAERGSATIWTVALAGVLAVVGAAAVLVGLAAVARHRAGAAADLAALAAAGRAVVGDPSACRSADRVARVNDGRLATCTVGEDAVVEVHVTVSVRLGPLGVRTATARARAGPAPVMRFPPRQAPGRPPAQKTRSGSLCSAAASCSAASTATFAR